MTSAFFWFSASFCCLLFPASFCSSSLFHSRHFKKKTAAKLFKVSCLDTVTSSVRLFPRNAVLWQRWGESLKKKKAQPQCKKLSFPVSWTLVVFCHRVWMKNKRRVGAFPRFGSQLAPWHVRVTVLWGPFCAISFAGFLSHFCFGRPSFINTINILQSVRLKKGQKRWMLSVVALKWNPPISNVWRHLEAPCVRTLIRPTAASVVYKIRWKNELLISSHHKEIFFFSFLVRFMAPFAQKSSVRLCDMRLKLSCTKWPVIISIRHYCFGFLFCFLALSKARNQVNRRFSLHNANQVEIISTQLWWEFTKIPLSALCCCCSFVSNWSLVLLAVLS